MIDLNKIPTTAPEHLDKKTIKAETAALVAEIGDWQNRLYANGQHSLLIVLQGMDGSGKDSTTRQLFSDCSPAGVQVTAFKKPTEQELKHDFLWRIHAQMPEKGLIKVFNRSHYEDILVPFVHGWIGVKQRQQRLEAINQFEKLAHTEGGTTVLKFYMHISFEEQENRLRERIEDPTKQWKHSDGDWKERALWQDYREAYHYILNNSTIPWVILPCDQVWYRNYTIAKTVLETLKGLDLPYPPLVSTLFKAPEA